MKKAFTLWFLSLITALTSLQLRAQVVEQSYPFEFGGQSEGLATDALDNLILAGAFIESANTNPYEISIVRKYSPAGTILWRGNVISPGISARGTGVCVDAAGNIYVVGQYFGTALELAGGPSLANFGSTDIFLAKYDQAGALQWLRTYGGTGYEEPTAISCDANGNLYIIGETIFSGSPIDFGNNITFPSSNLSGFMIKVLPGGTTAWAKSISKKASAVTVDPSGGSLVITGEFMNGAIGGLSIGGVNFPNATGSLFIARLDTSGVPLWVKTNTLQQPGIQSGFANALSTDTSGNIYVAGKYSGNLQWDGVTLNGGAYFRYAFLAKLDAAGTLLWHKIFYFAPNTFWGFNPTKLVIDKSGNCLLTGNFDENSITIDNHTFNITGTGDDILLFKFDPLGNYIWGLQGDGSQLTYGLGLDSENNCYLTGKITGGSGVYTMGSFSDYEKECYLYKINAGNHFNRVSGIAFYDANSNGIKDSAEFAAPGIVIESQPNPYYTTSGPDGRYNVYVDSGAVSIGMPAVPIYYSAVPANYSLSFNGSGFSDTIRHFALQPVHGMEDLRVFVSSPMPPRPGFDYVLHVSCKNVGTEPMSGTVELTLDSSLTFQSSAPVSVTSAATLTWSVSNLPASQTATFIVNTNVAASTILGTPISQLASVISAVPDLTPADNLYLFPDSVQGSFDPNDKHVNLATLTPTQVQNEKWLEYTIRFQNTGTDTAFTVRLADTLSAMLNIPSIELMASSHPFTWNLKGAGVMEWRFDNILLPDSNTNEAASHGFVKYRIKPKTSLAIGDVIENTAHIFFDFNEAVVTNTATTEVKLITSVPKSETNLLRIYPNPSKGHFTVQCSNIWASQVAAEMRNVLGQIVWQQILPVNNGKLQQMVRTSGLSKGVYYLQVKTEQGSKVQKVVLE